MNRQQAEARAFRNAQQALKRWPITIQETLAIEAYVVPDDIEGDYTVCSDYDLQTFYNGIEPVFDGFDALN